MNETLSTGGMQVAGRARAPGPRFLRRAGQIGGSQVIRRAARFLFLFAVARKLGPETFGTYALLLAVVETLALVSGEGLIDFLARESARTPEKARALFRQVTGLRAAYGAILLPLGLGLVYALGCRQEALGAAFWLFLTLFARAPLSAAQGVLRAADRVAPLVWIEAIQAAALLAALLPLLAGPMGLTGVAYAELLSTGAASAAGLLALRGMAKPARVAGPPWRELIRRTATFNLYPLITNIYDRIDIVLLSVLAGNIAAGLYALPYRALSVLQIVPFGLMTALLPGIAGRPQDDGKLCAEVSTALFTLSLFPVIAVMLLAGPMVGTVLGPAYRDSAALFRILVWAAIPMFVNFGLNNFLLARGRERVFLRTTLVSAAINILLNALLIPRFSFYAAAAVTIATECVLLAQNVLIIHRAFGFFPLPKALLGTSAVFAGLLLAALVGSVYLPPLLPAAAASALLALYAYRDGSLRSILRWPAPEGAAG
jgi:O-antigen/teichoic acid export membrane protein